jgi:prepilin peptidase CpaA
MLAIPCAREFVVTLFVGLLALAAARDLYDRQIPNQISVAIILLYPALVLLTPGPVEWRGALIVAIAMFALGAVLFALRLAGGGDVKLFAATSLWAGPALIYPLVLGTVLAGGGLALMVLVQCRLRRLCAGRAGGAGSAGSADEIEPELPYGVAIACGGLFVATRLLAV